MSTYELNKHRIEDVEYKIKAPLRAAISIPVLVDGEDVGIVVYIGVSQYSVNRENKDKDLKRIAKCLSFSY